MLFFLNETKIALNIMLQFKPDLEITYSFFLNAKGSEGYFLSFYLKVYKSQPYKSCTTVVKHLSC